MKIIHEDNDIIVLDKPAGIAVHSGNMKGTETTMVDYIRDKVEDSDTIRPGIVHRIDKDTSGVLVIAKNTEVKEYLQKQFKQRQVEKEYIAAVQGTPEPLRARIDIPLSRHPKNPMKRTVRKNGKDAITEYEVIQQKKNASLVKIYPLTGRTHQIRVHMQYIGHPILGDSMYAHKHPGLNRHFLHAHRLTFLHPSDHTKQTFTSELPEDLIKVWDNEDKELEIGK